MTVMVAEQVSSPEAPRRRANWIAFAGALLAVSGIFKVFDALWAFKYDDDDEVSTEVRTFIFERDLTSWGWVWLVAGIVLIATGFAVVTGAEWARWVGMVAATLAAITFLPWIYYQPLWTIFSVSLAMLVVYALAAYGGRQGMQ